MGLQATYPILISMISSISHKSYVTNLHLGEQIKLENYNKRATLATITTQGKYKVMREKGRSDIPPWQVIDQ